MDGCPLHHYIHFIIVQSQLVIDQIYFRVAMHHVAKHIVQMFGMHPFPPFFTNILDIYTKFGQFQLGKSPIVTWYSLMELGIPNSKKKALMYPRVGTSFERILIEVFMCNFFAICCHGQPLE